MKRATLAILLLALSVPALAHDTTTCPPSSTPALPAVSTGTGGQSDHLSLWDQARKPLAVLGLIGGVVYLTTKHRNDMADGRKDVQFKLGTTGADNGDIPR